jgi:hypothetical protein
MKNPLVPDKVTAAACQWLLAGAKDGAYTGPDPGEGHELTPLLSRETGRRAKALLSEADWVRREEVLSPTLESISRAGTSIWAFKGFDLARSIYPFTGARPMSDVDLFLRMDQRNQVLNAFRDSGWSLETPGRGVFGSGIVSEVKLMKMNVLAELHTHVFYFPATFPGSLPRDLFLGGRPLSPGLQGFSWHNSLLLVALHALTNSLIRPVWWVDLTLLCGKVTESGTWKEFTLNAMRTGLGHPVSSLLTIASDELSAEVPERTVHLLSGQSRRGDAILDGLRYGRKLPTAMNLRYLRGWRKITWMYVLVWMIISRRRPLTGEPGNPSRGAV